MQRERGSTLIISLVFLLVFLVMALSIFRGALTSSQAIGNMQWRNEAIAAANEAIDRCSAVRLRHADAGGCHAAGQRRAWNAVFTYDTNGDGNNEIARQLPGRQRRRPAPQVRLPACRPIPATELSPRARPGRRLLRRVPAPAASPSASRRRGDAGDGRRRSARTPNGRCAVRATDPSTSTSVDVVQGFAVRVPTVSVPPTATSPLHRLRLPRLHRRTRRSIRSTDMNRTSDSFALAQFGRRRARGGRRAATSGRCRHRHLREQRIGRRAERDVLPGQHGQLVDQKQDWTPEDSWAQVQRAIAAERRRSQCKAVNRDDLLRRQNASIEAALGRRLTTRTTRASRTQGKVSSKLRALKLVLKRWYAMAGTKPLTVNVGLSMFGVHGSARSSGRAPESLHPLRGAAADRTVDRRRAASRCSTSSMISTAGHRNPTYQGAVANANYGAAIYEIFKYFGGLYEPDAGHRRFDRRHRRSAPRATARALFEA